MRKRYILFSFSLALLFFFLVWATPVLMQEDNTLSVLSGIVRLSLSDTEVVKYDDDGNTLYYISKSSLDEKLLESVLPDDGFVLTDQMGSGYIFSDGQDPSRQVVVTGTQFTRFYRLWKVPENQ